MLLINKIVSINYIHSITELIFKQNISYFSKKVHFQKKPKHKKINTITLFKKKKPTVQIITFRAHSDITHQRFRVLTDSMI